MHTACEKFYSLNGCVVKTLADWPFEPPEGNSSWGDSNIRRDTSAWNHSGGGSSSDGWNGGGLNGSGWPKPLAEPSEVGSTLVGSIAWSSSNWTEGSYDWSDGSYDWSDGNRRLNNDDWSWSEANRGRARANSGSAIVDECDGVSI